MSFFFGNSISQTKENLKTTGSEIRDIINTNRKKNDKLHEELDCKLENVAIPFKTTFLSSNSSLILERWLLPLAMLAKGSRTIAR